MKEAIENYVTIVQDAYRKDQFWGGKDANGKEKNTFIIEWGKKFAKVSHISWGSKSVHCFIEIANGNLHKAATYKAPQKNGLRGNILNEKFPIFASDFYVR